MGPRTSLYCNHPSLDLGQGELRVLARNHKVAVQDHLHPPTVGSPGDSGNEGFGRLPSRDGAEAVHAGDYVFLFIRLASLLILVPPGVVESENRQRVTISVRGRALA